MKALLFQLIRVYVRLLVYITRLLNNFCQRLSRNTAGIDCTSMTGGNRLEQFPPEYWDDPRLGTHHFIQLKEVKLHYVSRGKDVNPLMLCLHGFPECWYTWRHILRQFSNDYKVVAVDMRGFSISEKPFGVDSYLKEKIVEDIKQLIEALGYKQSVLIGQGLGGLYLWDLAARYPSYVKQMITIQGNHPSALVEYMKNNWSQILLLLPICLFHLPIIPEFMFRYPRMKLIVETFNGKNGLRCNKMTEEDLDCYKFAAAQPGALTGALNHYRAMFLSKRRKPTKVSVPVLMIWGCRDPFLDRGLAEASLPYAEKMTLRLVEEAGHWVGLEQPMITYQCIKEFITV